MIPTNQGLVPKKMQTWQLPIDQGALGWKSESLALVCSTTPVRTLVTWFTQAGSNLPVRHFRSFANVLFSQRPSLNTKPTPKGQCTTKAEGRGPATCVDEACDAFSSSTERLVSLIIAEKLG